MLIWTSKILGVWDRFALKEVSVDKTDKLNINIFYLPGIRVCKGGSDCFVVVKADVIDVRLNVSIIMLANPIMMTIIIMRDSKPPVKVLYWVLAL